MDAYSPMAPEPTSWFSEEMSEKIQLDRGTWSKTIQYILYCLGSGVGLGFIWRFPYICYRNGGGAFLVPFFILLIMVGMPLFFLEISLGQFTSRGPTTTWGMNPFLKGIGWAMVLIAIMISIYYNVVVMYAMLYFITSLVHLGDRLPWQNCNNEWNTEYCRSQTYPNLENMNESYRYKILIDMKEMSCLNQSSVIEKVNTQFMLNITNVTQMNSSILESDIMDSCNKNLRTPAEEYWSRMVTRLHEAEPDRLENIGDINITNTTSLILAWTLLFFCIIKGIKSSGKVVYFTSTFPFVVLLVIFVRAITLEGSYAGVRFFIIPKWEKLAEPKVWADAASQVCFSIGTTLGFIITIGSYNKFNTNTLRDSIILPLVTFLVNIFGGFVVFATLGHMSRITNRSVSEVTESGPGLVFIAIPEAISKLIEPWPSIFAFLFYFMMMTMGLNSQMIIVQTIITGFSDAFPQMLRKHNTAFTAFVCLAGCFLGIPMTCKGGIYVLTLMDWYTGGYSSLTVGVCELLAVCWIYGVRNYRKDLEMMIGQRPDYLWAYWYFCWLFVIPVVLLFIAVMSAITYKPPFYIGPYGKYVFPSFAEAVGWLMSLGPVCVIVIVMIIEYLKKGGVKAACKPEAHWGPAHDTNRVGRYHPLSKTNIT